MPEDGHAREGEQARARTAQERRDRELRRADRIGGLSDQRERDDDAEVTDGDRQRSGRELARGRGAPHRGHPEERRDEHVCDELDLSRHDPDV